MHHVVTFVLKYYNLQRIVTLKYIQHIYTAYNKRKLALCDGYKVCHDLQCLWGFPSFYVRFGRYVGVCQGLVLAAPLWLLLHERLSLPLAVPDLLPRHLLPFGGEIRPARADLRISIL